MTSVKAIEQNVPERQKITMTNFSKNRKCHRLMIHLNTKDDINRYLRHNKLSNQLHGTESVLRNLQSINYSKVFRPLWKRKFH